MPTPTVLAGEVAANGTIVRGTGFTVLRARRGIYAITFPPSLLDTGCAAVTVTPQVPVIPVAYQTRCNGQVVVTLYAQGSKLKVDEAFSFTAIED